MQAGLDGRDLAVDLGAPDQTALAFDPEQAESAASAADGRALQAHGAIRAGLLAGLQPGELLVGVNERLPLGAESGEVLEDNGSARQVSRLLGKRRPTQSHCQKPDLTDDQR